MIAILPEWCMFQPAATLEGLVICGGYPMGQRRLDSQSPGRHRHPGRHQPWYPEHPLSFQQFLTQETNWKRTPSQAHTHTATHTCICCVQATLPCPSSQCCKNRSDLMAAQGLKVNMIWHAESDSRGFLLLRHKIPRTMDSYSRLNAAERSWGQCDSHWICSFVKVPFAPWFKGKYKETLSSRHAWSVV